MHAFQRYTLIMAWVILPWLTLPAFCASSFPETNVNEPGIPDPSPYTIGLLVPVKEDVTAVQAANLAIEEANAMGGHPFLLVNRSTDGLWGAGSSQSVHLVFEDHVLAYMGALDGRNAHLAEQVATKTKVAFLSARATDMTLSYAFVPWYFRCVPDDKSQAACLLNEICSVRKLTRYAVISTPDYDAIQATHTLVKTARERSLATPMQFTLDPEAAGVTDPFPEIREGEAAAIILIGPPALAERLMPLYRKARCSLPVFATLSVLDDPLTEGHEWETYMPMTVVSPGYLFSDEGRRFIEHFTSRYGYPPGPVAAYAYDATRIIITAIRKAGPDRDRVIQAITHLHYHGITGEMGFDDKGNRKSKVSLMTIGNGKEIPLTEK